MFVDELRQMTKQVTDLKDATTRSNALEYLEKEVKETLKEAACRGHSEYIVDLKDKEDLFISTIQKELTKEGLATKNLKDKQLKISWDKSIETIPGELFRWYDLENTIDEIHTEINYSSTDLDEVKENMDRFGDWYRDNGTGTIYRNLVIKNNNIIELKRKEVFRK